MAMRRKHFPQRSTDLAATAIMAVSAIMIVGWAVAMSLLGGVLLSPVGHARCPFGRTGFDSATMTVPECSVASSAASR